MTLTTIKVTGELRDQLKRQAARHQRTLGEHLSVLVAEEERRRRFVDLADAMRAHPVDDRYEADLRAWSSDAG